MKRRLFPIRDIQFHIEGLRQRNATTVSVEELNLLTSWHSSAIAYLQYGTFHKLNGPGAERVLPDGKVEPAEIEDFLTLVKGAKGESYFVKTFKKYSTNGIQPLGHVNNENEVPSPGRELAAIVGPSGQ